MAPVEVYHPLPWPASLGFEGAVLLGFDVGGAGPVGYEPEVSAGEVSRVGDEGLHVVDVGEEAGEDWALVPGYRRGLHLPDDASLQVEEGMELHVAPPLSSAGVGLGPLTAELAEARGIGAEAPGPFDPFPNLLVQPSHVVVCEPPPRPVEARPVGRVLQPQEAQVLPVPFHVRRVCPFGLALHLLPEGDHRQGPGVVGLPSDAFPAAVLGRRQRPNGPLQQPECLVPFYLTQALVQSPVKLFLPSFHVEIQSFST